VKSTFWIFARRLLRYRWLLIGAGTCALISAGSLGAGLVGIKPILDSVLGQSRKGLPELAADFNARGHALQIPQSVIDQLPTGPFTAITAVIIGLGILTLFGATANFFHEFLSLTVVNRTIAGIRRDAFRKVLKLPLRDVVAIGPGDLISRVFNETGAIALGLSTLMSRALAQLTKGLAAFVAALVIDYRLTLAALIIAPGMVVIIRKLGKHIRRASRHAMESTAGMVSSTTESLMGLRVVRVNTAEQHEAAKFHQLNKTILEMTNRYRTARALSSPLVEALTVFVLGGLTLVATKFILDGHLDPTEFVLTLGSLGLAAASLKPLSTMITDIQFSAAASERVAHMLDMPEEPGREPGLLTMPRHGESIEFRGVTFSYPNAPRPALNNVSLSIRHGETVAVVGPNGSGKTTLLALIPRLFEPDQGQVLVDGSDIRRFGVTSLRRQIGVVTQETVLFRGTIRSNVIFGGKCVTDEQVRAAIEKARATDFIRLKSGGLDEPVAEQGASLSGGQRQRLAIARAILRDPSILILDEATSMIDADSEAKIAEAVREFAKGRTCLIVAHRLATVVNADRIVVMDEGRIVDVGRHAELMTRCATYRLIAEHQLIKADAGPTDPAASAPEPAATA
jgi:ABC-type multidrug transport system fused ATPase/permease subunit